MSQVVPFQCEVCGTFSEVLHRVSPKGEDGVWRCWTHLTEAQRKAADPDLKELADLLMTEGKKKHG